MPGAPINPLDPPELFDPTYLNVSYLFNQILEFFRNLGAGDGISVPFAYLLFYLKVFGGVVSILAIFGIFWYLLKLQDVWARYNAQFIYAEPVEAEDQRRNERWERVKLLMDSSNENDWRQAIIEADVMLDDIVTRMGYHGETLGERLQAVEPSDFLTLDAAWEAHKVRNQIAHDGGAFILTEREAKRVIALFEKVFKEFQYV